jgi:hypothetical protein
MEVSLDIIKSHTSFDEENVDYLHDPFLKHHIQHFNGCPSLPGNVYFKFFYDFSQVV